MQHAQKTRKEENRKAKTRGGVIMTESTKHSRFPVKGMFGDSGGSYVLENLAPVLEEIAAEYEKCRNSSAFKESISHC